LTHPLLIMPQESPRNDRGALDKSRYRIKSRRTMAHFHCQTSTISLWVAAIMRWWVKTPEQASNVDIPDSVAYFSAPFYQLHNIARLQHLDSLGLDLSRKRVIEFGAGIGDHTLFYLYRNCEVLATEGRPELVEIMKHRLGIAAIQLDVEQQIGEIARLSRAEIIHCYGLLYHLSNPKEFLQAISSKGELLLLETCVSPDDWPEGVHLIDEANSNATQAVSGKGCRPTRTWILKTLKQFYNCVYFPKTQPKHQEFPSNWTPDAPRSSKLMRCIFIACHGKIANDKLTEKMPVSYQSW
jgi:hypothetical protein